MLKILVLSFLIVLTAQNTNAQTCYQTKEGKVCDICAELCFTFINTCRVCGVAIEPCARGLCPQSCINVGGAWNNTWKPADGCGRTGLSKVTCGCTMYEGTKQKIRKK